MFHSWLRGPPGLHTAFLWCDQKTLKRDVIICPSLSNYGWTKGTIPISDHRYTIAQSQYVKGTMGILDTTEISHSDPWISP